MAKASPRTPVQGPAFIRLLAGLSDAAVPSNGPGWSERLGEWIDWTRAVALARALDGRLPEAGTDAPVDGADATACARQRTALEQAIVEATASVPALADAGDYAPFRQRYLERQRAMLTSTGHLRGLLREQLARRSAALARLAELDAVMEAALSPREHVLLAAVPELLGAHFARLHAAAADTTADGRAEAWLDGFRMDMRGVLLAELDVRFHPIEALLAALRS